VSPSPAETSPRTTFAPDKDFKPADDITIVCDRRPTDRDPHQALRRLIDLIPARPYGIVTTATAKPPRVRVSPLIRAVAGGWKPVV
jgi:hypothetical protein